MELNWGYNAPVCLGMQEYVDASVIFPLSSRVYLVPDYSPSASSSLFLIGESNLGHWKIELTSQECFESLNPEAPCFGTVDSF